MKTFVLCALVGLTLAAPILRAQVNPTSAAPIPEEARKHFIMGTTLFKDAKTPDDYAQVESQFKQAVDLAPQWPDPRYNLALAKEAAGDYAGAMADLKIYLQFKLSEADARTAQDKIYVIEAKQNEANSPEGKIRSAQHQFAALMQKLDGAVFVKEDNDANEGGNDGNPTLHEVRFYRSESNSLLMCQSRIKGHAPNPNIKIDSDGYFTDVFTYEWKIEYSGNVFPKHADGHSDLWFLDNGEVFFEGCGIIGRLSADGNTFDKIAAYVPILKVMEVWHRQ